MSLCDKDNLGVVWSDGVVIIPAYQWSAFLLNLQKRGITFNLRSTPCNSPEGIKLLNSLGLVTK